MLIWYRQSIALVSKHFVCISYVNLIHGLDIKMAAPNIEDCACLVNINTTNMSIGSAEIMRNN